MVAKPRHEDEGFAAFGPALAGLHTSPHTRRSMLYQLMDIVVPTANAMGIVLTPILAAPVRSSPSTLL